MKRILSYSAAALLGMAMLSSCGEDFTYPPVILPSVDVKPTVTLQDFKARYWRNIENGPSTVGFYTSETKDSVIFIGRVCSSDKTGNIYKNIIVQSKDENGEQVAVTFSVNGYDLYENLPFGQEVAVYATGLQVGGYRGLFQFGAASGNEMTFMDKSLFAAHVIRNHTVIPHPELVDTTVATIPEIIAAKGNQESLRKWQSRLIRIEGVSFTEAGQPFAGSSTVNRNIVDENGNKLIVRNSSYSDFANERLPYGKGNVTGILSYFGSDWQILLIDAEGCSDFDGTAPEPVEPDAPAGEGTAESPFNVAKVLAVGKTMLNQEVYVKGKIASITELNTTNYGNATINIADKEGDATFLAYRGYWLGGTKYTSADQLAVGADVVLYGKLTEYNGTLQLGTGYTMISYNGQTSGGDTPSAGTIFEQSFVTQESFDTFTVDNKKLPSDLSYVWSWGGANYGAKASAFKNNTSYPSESWLISPEIDLTGCTKVTLVFDHVVNKFPDLAFAKANCTLWARVKGGEWAQITIPTYTDNTSWNFGTSGNISLGDYEGKVMQFAFKYVSEDGKSGTWEIKNLAVRGAK